MRLDGDKYVYDAVDEHKTFVRQHQTRNSAYKKNGYIIHNASAAKYTGETTKWNVVYVPKGQSDKLQTDRVDGGDAPDFIDESEFAPLETSERDPSDDDPPSVCMFDADDE